MIVKVVDDTSSTAPRSVIMSLKVRPMPRLGADQPSTVWNRSGGRMKPTMMKEQEWEGVGGSGRQQC